MAKKSLDPESATTQVNIADFQRTRDSVIVALATLQSSVQDLSRAYIQHANTVLTPGKHGLNPIDANLTSILTESGLLAGRPADAPPAAVPEVETDGKKKRKRTPHDPNAPKRALTPYFLYMQSARAQIAKELGDQAKPKEVADEGTRRWTEMKPAEKSVWDDKYQKNLAAYRVKMAAYKAGQPVPSDDEASRLVEMGKAPDHIAGMDAEAETEEEEAAAASEDDSPVPVKEPSPPKSSKRRKTKDATPSKPTPKAEAAKSPEKKSKKGKKDALPSAPASTTKTEKSRKGKK
ncbi:hypothetical protein, variant [Exophiala oligosperma]|uniref:HMG box domain-containing protein n=2 Tax=Chaetothyriales TaxID=34395 RepID=A0A0D2DNF5_9EURO|nr:hypothetical protein, variant [Exophiala oligosperma]KAJ9646882.1 hypothetical protein H2204_000574 [Knufia peltigerae]KIW37324.1 hypothetical protein, variant [Exophiala oligosperma]